MTLHNFSFPLRPAAVALAAALVLASCTDNNAPGGMDGNGLTPLRITASDAQQAQTDGARTDAARTRANAPLGLYTGSLGVFCVPVTPPGNGLAYTNLSYIFDPRAGWIGEDDKNTAYLTDSPVTVYAYAPYAAANTDLAAIPFGQYARVTADADKPGGFAFTATPPQADGVHPNVELQMTQVMAGIRLNITAMDDATTATFKSIRMYNPYTTEFLQTTGTADLTTGTVTYDEPKTADFLLLKEGTDPMIKVTTAGMQATASKDDGSYHLLGSLIPQTIENGLTFEFVTDAGETLTLGVDGDYIPQIEVGKLYTLNIKLGKTPAYSLTLTGVSVTDWTDTDLPAHAYDGYLEFHGNKWTLYNLQYDTEYYSNYATQDDPGSVYEWNSPVPGTVNNAAAWTEGQDPCYWVVPLGTWKTPTLAQFQSLCNFDWRYTVTWTDSAIFHDEVDGSYLSLPRGVYWTSTVTGGVPQAFDMQRSATLGTVIQAKKTDRYIVRCVKK